MKLNKATAVCLSVSAGILLLNLFSYMIFPERLMLFSLFSSGYTYVDSPFFFIGAFIASAACSFSCAYTEKYKKWIVINCLLLLMDLYCVVSAIILTA